MTREYVLYPAVRLYCADSNRSLLYFNQHTRPHLFGPRIAVSKAKIRGVWYACFTNTEIGGYISIKTGKTVSIPAVTILEFLGIPAGSFGIRRCVRIRNGVAFRITEAV